MDDATPALDRPGLEPLAYHRLIVAHLRDNEPEIWRWASSLPAQQDQANDVRAQLLRDTYRLDAASHPQVHSDCAAVLAAFGIDAPATLYQAGDGAMNAALCFIPGEVHLMFQGPVLEKLNPAERAALIGHEVAHYRLWSMDDGAYYAATRILDHALAYPDATPSHVETARLYSLHTELFADRGGALAAGAPEPAIGALVKVMTGLTSVDPAAYLRQAAEADAGALASQGQTHPEIFLRAQALDRWWRRQPDLETWLDLRIRGPLSLAGLDLARQDEATALTRSFLTRLAADPAANPDASDSLIRRYFPDWRAGEASVDTALLSPDRLDASFRDYLVALSLDMAMADPDGRDEMLIAGARLAVSYDGTEAFKTALKRDLKLGKAAIDRIVSPKARRA